MRVTWRDKIIFFPVHLTLSTVISTKNEGYERRYYSNYRDSYLGSGFLQQFEQMASGRQASSIRSGASKRKSSKICSSYTGNGPKITICWRAENQERVAWTKFEKSCTLTLNLIKYFEKYRCHSIYESE